MRLRERISFIHSPTLISKKQIWGKIQISCFSVKCLLHYVAFHDSYLEASWDPVEQSVTLGLSVRESGAREKPGERSLWAAEFICWWYWRKVRTEWLIFIQADVIPRCSQKTPHSKFSGCSIPSLVSLITFGSGAVQPYSAGQNFHLTQSRAFQSPFQRSSCYPPDGEAGLPTLSLDPSTVRTGSQHIISDCLDFCFSELCPVTLYLNTCDWPVLKILSLRT